MKQAIRYFSLGLLLSVLLLYGYQFFNKEDRAASFSEEELIDLVEDEGYHVITNEEYSTYSLNKDENITKKENKEETGKKEETTNSEEKEKQEEKKKEDKDDDKKEEKSDDNEDEEDEEDEVVKASIKVDENTYTPDIADKLIDKKIIDKDEGDKFIEYIEDNDYSDYIQLGTFKVDSEMSMKDLAETFTTYPGD